MKFDSNKLGLALAGSFGATYTVMFLLGVLWPSAAVNMQHGLFHFHVIDYSLNEYICGLLRTVVYSYLFGAFFAYVSNNVNK